MPYSNLTHMLKLLRNKPEKLNKMELKIKKPPLKTTRKSENNMLKDQTLGSPTIERTLKTLP
jgi:hypothetical protein